MYDSFENLEKVKFVGKGAFGEVYKFIDKRVNKKIALKVVNNEKRFLRAAKKEINVLKILKLANTDNNPVITMLGEFILNNRQYIIFEYMSIDLYKFYKKYPQEIDLDLGIYIFYYITKGLQFIHSLKIIHSDLKPENIMIGYRKDYNDQRKYLIKIIDFGSTLEDKTNNSDNENKNFYIQSRYYRAPEVLYKIDYGICIDIWSLGCIFFEMLFKDPLFGGKNEKDMVYLISELIDIPYKYNKYFISKHFYNLYGYNYIKKEYFFKIPENKKNIKPSTEGLSEFLDYKFNLYIGKDRRQKYFISILKKILIYDYIKRITAEEVIYDIIFLEFRLKGIIK